MARKKKKSGLSTIADFMSEKSKKKLAQKTIREADLLSIRPDPKQPRRLLPPKLATTFEAGKMSPQETVEAWATMDHSPFSELQKLANSIAQHGLINPISVRKTPEGTLPAEIQYLIVTGERRWWAHVLLDANERQIQEGSTTKKADQIKINLVAEGVTIRAHQLIENLIREDINAIEKAAGMWALRYELSDLEFTAVPTSVEAKKVNLVPWKKIEDSLQISDRYRRYVILVLRLPSDAQEIIQRHNLSESMIRPIAQKLFEYPELQIQVLEQLLAWQNEEEDRSLVREVRKLVDDLLIATTTPDSGPHLVEATTNDEFSALPITKEEEFIPPSGDSNKASIINQDQDTDTRDLPAVSETTRTDHNDPNNKSIVNSRETNEHELEETHSPKSRQKIHSRLNKSPTLTQFPDVSLHLLQILDLINPNNSSDIKELKKMENKLQTLKSKIDNLLVLSQVST